MMQSYTSQWTLEVNGFYKKVNAVSTCRDEHNTAVVHALLMRFDDIMDLVRRNAVGERYIRDLWSQYIIQRIHVECTFFSLLDPLVPELEQYLIQFGSEYFPSIEVTAVDHNDAFSGRLIRSVHLAGNYEVFPAWYWFVLLHRSFHVTKGSEDHLFSLDNSGSFYTPSDVPRHRVAYERLKQDDRLAITLNMLSMSRGYLSARSLLELGKATSVPDINEQALFRLQSFFNVYIAKNWSKVA